MKLITRKNRNLLLVILVFALFGCYDDKMEWAVPDGHLPVEHSEIPLELAEKIANYDFIKSYVPQGMTLGVGIGADLYLANEQYKQVVDDNFQIITLGNAMKHSSVVKNNGDLDFTTIDAFFNAIPADMQVYGHTLLWHTQQRQAYLKSLIAPEVIIKSDPDATVENIIQNSDFESGNIDLWSSWGNESTRSISNQGEGYDSDYSLVLMNPSDADFWSAQAAYDLDSFLEEEVVYAFQFWAKSDLGAGELQFQVQNSSTNGSQEAYTEFNVGTSWVLCEGEFTCSFDDVNRLLINFGKVAGTYYIDDFKFGKKLEADYNLMPNGSFEDGDEGWSFENIGAGIEVVSLDDAPHGSKALRLIASESSSNAWDLQVISPSIPATHGQQVQLSFFIKADQPGQGRVSFQGLTNNYPWMDWTGSQDSWSEAFDVSTSWQQISVIPQKFDADFEEGETTWRCAFDLGYLPDVTYYLDNIRIVTVEEESEPAEVKRRVKQASSEIIYVYKTEEEKKEALLEAMENWIEGILTHCGDKVNAWDVINEPISDNNAWRGINGNFMNDDSMPEENNGLDLNWDNDHFYWGYYIGREYAVKAFEYARKYASAGTKLYVNDYNLEHNKSKLNTLIEFVNYIEDNGQTVDGIGTQMHVSADTTAVFKNQIDDMFQTLAATGKLIRVTEFDVKVETQTQVGRAGNIALTYQYVVESYIKHIPEEQRSGITIWGLTDDLKNMNIGC